MSTQSVLTRVVYVSLAVAAVLLFSPSQAIGDPILADRLWEPFEPDGYLEYVSDFQRFGDEQVGSTRIVLPFTDRSTFRDDNHLFGNIADFDWVEDDRHAGPDNHTGVDFLVWSQGNPMGPDHAGHNHGVDPLSNDRWLMPTFRAVDVFSLSLFDDDPNDPTGHDVDDIDPFLRIDFLVFGSNDRITWNAATLVITWTQGWIPNGTSGLDAVSRWDLGAEYRFVGIRALDNENAQIDAVKALPAAAVPEPTTIVLTGAGLAGLVRRVRKTRR